MSIENDVIVSKLKLEGISEKLGNGLTFETDDELNVWVESYKSGQPAKIRGLGEYTEDELKKLADSGDNKILQSLLDKVRTASKPKPDAPEKKVEQAEKPEWATEIMDELAKQKTALAEQKTKDEAKENKDNAIKLIKAQKITEPEDIDMVLLKLGSDLSEANIKTKSEEYTAFLTKKGIKHLPGASDAKPEEAIVKAAKEFSDMKLKQKKHFKSKN